MGSLLSAIRDDINDYRWLCGHFKVKVRYTNTAQGIPVEDCYGSHAKELETRFDKEQAKKKKRKR